MPRRTQPARYPWGAESPSTRIRTVSKNALVTLEKAREPGFADVHRLATAAVRASRPLTETLEHLAQSGLQIGDASNRLPTSDVLDAVKTVHESVGAFARASNLDWSECFNAFEGSVRKLAETAAAVAKRGVARPEEPRGSDLWSSFED